MLRTLFRWGWRILKGTTLLILVVAAYLLWPGFALDTDAPPESFLKVEKAYGRDEGAGNVVGIEPYMELIDYSSPKRFADKLDLYFKAAQEKGWFGEKTVVLLPEHLGTWLVAEGHKSRVFNAATTSEAMRYVAAWQPLDILRYLFVFESEKPLEAALFRSRAGRIAEIQYNTYASLAKKYRVTLVAGSSVLMTPGVYENGLAYGHGPLFNAGFVFSPDGTAQLDAVRKVHPVGMEVGLVKGGDPDFLLAYDTPAGKIAPLICADSWFSDTYTAVAAQGAEIVLIPAFLAEAHWTDKWRGYEDDQPATDDWLTDVGQLSEGEAWQKYTLANPVHNPSIKTGMAVFLKGKLWDITGSGRALIMRDGELSVGDNDDTGAAIYNLWLKVG